VTQADANTADNIAAFFTGVMEPSQDYPWLVLAAANAGVI